jgi:hypothetical protein
MYVVNAIYWIECIEDSNGNNGSYETKLFYKTELSNVFGFKNEEIGQKSEHEHNEELHGQFSHLKLTRQ